MVNTLVLEICADSVESAVAAEQGGAQRIELCGSLLEGGITPSAGMIAAVHKRISIPLHVMVRPRGGDFCYSADELEVMRHDVLFAKQLGANGIVFGILQEDGQVDRERTRHLIEAAKPLSVTFHRAFDMAKDLRQALDDIIAAGAQRVLTSGGEKTAMAGTDAIADLVKYAGGRIVIIAASGINSSNIRELTAKTGVSEIHASLRTPMASSMRYRKESLSMGAVTGLEYERLIVLKEHVSRLRDAARNSGER